MRAELQQQVSLRDRYEPLLEEADRDRGREQLDTRVERLALQRGSKFVAGGSGEQRAPDIRPFVDHDDGLTALRRLDTSLVIDNAQNV